MPVRNSDVDMLCLSPVVHPPDSGSWQRGVSQDLMGVAVPAKEPAGWWKTGLLSGQPCSPQQPLWSHWAQSPSDIALMVFPKREVSPCVLAEEIGYCRRSKLCKTFRTLQRHSLLFPNEDPLMALQRKEGSG